MVENHVVGALRPARRPQHNLMVDRLHELVVPLKVFLCERNCICAFVAARFHNQVHLVIVQVVPLEALFVVVPVKAYHLLVKCVAVYLRELPEQSSSLISYVSGLTEKDNFIEVFAVLSLDLAASDGFEKLTRQVPHLLSNRECIFLPFAPLRLEVQPAVKVVLA